MYVIGGLIDRTVKPGVSLKMARQHGLPTARLPIQEYIPYRQTHVLNVDTIMKIICLYAEYTGDWKRVLEEAMPVRKQSSKNMKTHVPRSLSREDSKRSWRE